jgi:hypothetical protein
VTCGTTYANILTHIDFTKLGNGKSRGWHRGRGGDLRARIVRVYVHGGRLK